MKRLIVNADDLGNGSCRDRGIFHAYTDGIVTSASLLANGPTFEAAAREALALRLPLGVHLNLSEGTSLTGVLTGLTDVAGEFPGKELTRDRLASGDFDRDAVRQELLAQIARVRETGLTPDHLDTHQHCILFPALCEVVLEVACETGITAMRLPLPAESETVDPTGKVGADIALYRRLATELETTVKKANISTPDGLWGMPLLNRLDEETLVELLANLPEGTWELMTHPGYSSATEAFSGPARERELAALTSPVVRELVVTRVIELTTFGACQCAC